VFRKKPRTDPAQASKPPVTDSLAPTRPRGLAVGKEAPDAVPDAQAEVTMETAPPAPGGAAAGAEAPAEGTMASGPPSPVLGDAGVAAPPERTEPDPGDAAPRPASAPAATPSAPTGAGVAALLGKPLPPGGLRFGKYHLRKELGRGGMGVVYQATDTTLQRDVALKLMLTQDVPPEELRRFQLEAEASAALTHPAIVAVHAVGEIEGKLFFEMDFVPGTTLKSVIADHAGDLPLLLGIFERVCEGVGFAHRKGIIHRDLKPQNIMVDAEMRPHIMDFGLARRLEPEEMRRGSEESKRRARASRIGEVMGTPAYMPPEQAAGRTDDVDTRSDIYSLGVILYALVTGGELPFRAPTTNELLRMVLEYAPIPPRERTAACPWELERVVLKAIEKEREARHQTAFDLRDDVLAWLAHRPVPAVRGGPLYRARKLVRRNRGAVALAGAITLAAAGLVSRQLQVAAEERARSRAEAAVKTAWAEALLTGADARRAHFEARRDALGTLEARAVLGQSRGLYLDASGLLLAAEALDPERADARALSTRAQLGRQAVKDAEDRVSERQGREEQLLAFRAEALRVARAERTRLDGVDPDAPVTTAEADAARALLDQARAGFLRASALDETLLEAQRGLDDVIEAQARLARRTGRLATLEAAAARRGEAEAALLEAAREAPTPEGRARALETLGRATMALSEALRLDGGAPETVRRRVDAAIATGEVALASRLFQLGEHAVRDVRPLDPTRTARFLERSARASSDERRCAAALEAAAIALAEERWKEARVAFEEALRAAPGRAEAETGLRYADGARAASEGRHEEALPLFAAAARFASHELERGALERATARSRAAVVDAALAAARRDMEALDLAAAEAHVARALRFAPEDARALALRDEAQARRRAPEGMVLLPAGPFPFGKDALPREAGACFIARTEATNAEYQAFVEAGGYAQDQLWDDEGLAARAAFTGRDGRPGPLLWRQGRAPEGSQREPVRGISWFEARAFARWRGKGFRLPSEVEWEKAAAFDPASRRRLPPPWLEAAKDGLPRAPWEGIWSAYLHARGPRPVDAPLGRARDGAPVLDRGGIDVSGVRGNVREWVTVATPAQGEGPALRGGSFASRTEERADLLRSLPADPLHRAHDVGVRLARSITPETPR